MDCLTQKCTSWSKLIRAAAQKACALPRADTADPRPGTRRPLRLLPSAPLHTRTPCFMGDRPASEPADAPGDDPKVPNLPEPNPVYDMEQTFEAGALHTDAWEIGCYEGDDSLCDDA
jgi:hypothetical protein